MASPLLMRRMQGASFSDSIPLPTTIGEAFGGGYYIGDVTIVGGADAGTYAVIMANAEGSYAWRSSGSTVIGASSLKDGKANTATMISAGSHPAATYCDGYSKDGYTDWYMPAKDELHLAYTNKSSLGVLGLGFSYKWSSSEFAVNTAWSEYFGSGYQEAGTKSTSYAVRPVRRLKKS